MVKKMPIILLGLIAFVLLVGAWLPLELKQALYAVSLSIKSFIVLALPIIIFGLLFQSAVLMAERATWVIGLVLLGVTCSTFMAVFIARFVGIQLYQMDISMALPPQTQSLIPLWVFDVQTWVPNEWVMAAALIMGISGALWLPHQATRLAGILDRIVKQILAALSLMIPFFVLGFVVKLQYEGVIDLILTQYSLIFGVIALSQFSYIIMLYWGFAGGSLKKTGQSLRAMVPAAISGFTTMSSAASLPLIINGIELNTKHHHLARIITPILVNIHMIGECFADVILAYAVLKTYGVAAPTIGAYLLFAGYFMVARFSVAGIPGGGILVIHPILKHYFNFNDEMLTLITALYILFDPLLTAANILGDGVFAQGLDRIVSKFPWIAYAKKDIKNVPL